LELGRRRCFTQRDGLQSFFEFFTLLMVSIIWGICISLKAIPNGSNTKSFDTVLPRCDQADRLRRLMFSSVGSVFEFSQIGHHGIERWSFGKEHLPHAPVVASNLRNAGFRRAYPKASGLGQILPRRSFSKEDLLVLHHACQQAKIFHRKLAVLVPVQTCQVVVVPRETGRNLA
jgi:hypothetical protein